MKTRSLLLAFFASGLVFAPQALAQPEGLHPPDDHTKTLSCEQLKQLVMSPKLSCLMADLTFKGFVWCADSQEEFDSYGTDYNYSYWSLYYRDLAPDYQYDFDREECLTGIKAEGATESPPEQKRSVAQTVDDWIMENDLVFDPARIEQMERERNEVYRKQAELKEAMFAKAQEAWKAEMVKLQAEFLIEPKFDFVWEGEWPSVKTAVFDAESGAVIQSDSWQNIYLQYLADEVTKKVVLEQGEMEIKVIDANPEANKVSVSVDDFFDIFVIQTHFWVKYDPDKKLAAINVYEGQVEVRTKDGKSVKITPNGKEPGVLLISRRPSVGKLALAGLTLTAIIGGAIFFKKRKK